jgi:hypothetical protein
MVFAALVAILAIALAMPAVQSNIRTTDPKVSYGQLQTDCRPMRPFQQWHHFVSDGSAAS